MKNALISWEDLPLLKICNFKSEELQAKLLTIANAILNNSLLLVNDITYRICEIEFYINANEYPDPYSYCHPEQLEFGYWHFHRVSREPLATFKGGTYKGVDLTLGDGKNYVGVLLRRIVHLETKKSIEGPSLIVDEILNQSANNSIKQILEKDAFSINLIPSNNYFNREIITSPRIGLKPKCDLNEDRRYVEFLFKPLRFLVEPKLSKKGRVLLFLYKASTSGLEKAIKITGVRLIDAQKYFAWCNQGRNMNFNNLLNSFDNQVENICLLYGAYLNYLETKNGISQ